MNRRSQYLVPIVLALDWAIDTALNADSPIAFRRANQAVVRAILRLQE